MTRKGFKVVAVYDTTVKKSQRTTELLLMTSSKPLELAVSKLGVLGNEGFTIFQFYSHTYNNTSSMKGRSSYHSPLRDWIWAPNNDAWNARYFNQLCHRWKGIAVPFCRGLKSNIQSRFCNIFAELAIRRPRHTPFSQGSRFQPCILNCSPDTVLRVIRRSPSKNPSIFCNNYCTCNRFRKRRTRATFTSTCVCQLYCLAHLLFVKVTCFITLIINNIYSFLI
mmetsp:Transcript_14223/g.20007  ORF Transcript_14223/g.20007 Transcript_14223/m.20007 type:complete len:223 (+) Transcript_14223:2024-2692(+)